MDIHEPRWRALTREAWVACTNPGRDDRGMTGAELVLTVLVSDALILLVYFGLLVRAFN
jgi:hypothetical protein